MEQTIHWADVVANEALTKSDTHIVATGITPSGNIHIGNMREVVTADAVYRALIDSGGNADLIYIADTFDPLRKVYPFLDESYQEHVGKPLSEIPCPCSKHSNYAQHFLEPFLQSLDKLDIHPKVILADELYKEGAFVDAIKTALIKRDEIANIIETVSSRTIDSEWSPFNPICSNCWRLTTTKVTDFDTDRQTVDYTCSCGSTGTVSMQGGGKLTWRVDWPARWPILGVTIEPFGKDHASAGGSYDTGKRISDEIYHYPAPHPIIYEWIMLKGKGAMSSSTGVTVSISDMLKIVPPEVLRYLIIRSKPEKHIEFDPGLPLLNLIDEYDNLSDDPEKSQDIRGYQLSQTKADASAKIPFKHMVTAIQIADHSFDYLLTVLQRGGYDVTDVENIRQRADNAQNWLTTFAPPMVKFTISKNLPPETRNFNAQQREALRILSEKMSGYNDAQTVHDGIYTLAREMDISPKKLFTTIYQSLLGTRSGPRLGYFLVSMDRDFVVERFEEASSLNRLHMH
ncbi:MAG: lysyl-tRNA synthetase, class 1 [Candidatus Methanomarinus sp.]|nr:MAG: lysyl-tRNA synthetase, class 1 [ANME-2 cluster archaeon]